MVWVWVTAAFLAGMIFGVIVIAVCAANDAYLHENCHEKRGGGQ